LLRTSSPLRIKVLWLAGLGQKVAALDSMKKGGRLLLEEERQHLFRSSLVARILLWPAGCGRGSGF
ncbi:hypothetical protein BHE74_00026283, partial [Ensete ventricosum]